MGGFVGDLNTGLEIGMRRGAATGRCESGDFVGDSTANSNDNGHMDNGQLRNIVINRATAPCGPPQIWTWAGLR